MISDARGGHVSPGVYTEEQEVTYSVKSLGITNLGLAGETLKGPAFQPIQISDWTEFTDYFGGTSTEKFKGTGLPKYELPYIAKEYLTESKQLQVVRVLGLSGYKTSDAYVIAAKISGLTYPLVVLRSQMSYGNASNICETSTNCDVLLPWVSAVTITGYKSTSFGSNCEVISGSSEEQSLSGYVAYDSVNHYNVVCTDLNSASTTQISLNKFGIKVDYLNGSSATTSAITSVEYNVSLNPNDVDYIYNVLPTNPTTDLKCPIFVEAVYDYSYDEIILDAVSGSSIELCELSADTKHSDFREPFRCAETPWVVSNIRSVSSQAIEMKRLFKFFTISDGNAANRQVKISIQNIKPEAGTFDVLVRDYYDTDESIVVLEKFTKCCLKEGESNFIGLKIGTFDGGYETKSKYITVMLNDELAELKDVNKYVPAGFLGYPIPKYGADRNVEVVYNRYYDVDVKSKRQYFGLNANVLDEDMLDYKGIDAYSDAEYDFNPAYLTDGFHLDSIMAEDVMNASGSAISGATIRVDGVSGFTFKTVYSAQAGLSYNRIPRILTEAYMAETIYSDVNLRKFTVYPYGGFDGWDIYRTARTNGDAYKSTKMMAHTYKNASGETVTHDDSAFKRIGSNASETNPGVDLKLPANAISSDYYAFLGAYNQFSNPQDIDINIFATPGIDWANNEQLVEAALDVIEDADDGRGGDAVYIPTTPQFDENGDILDEDAVVSLLDACEIDTSYAATYYPWVKYYDSTEKTYINLPATKDVVRNMAYTDNHLYPWYAPAGTSRGTVNCIKAVKKTTLASEDTLYENRINPIKTFAEDGVVVWGNKTMYSQDTPLNRLNVRRLMIRVKKLVKRAAKDLIFEQYDTTLEKQFKSLVEPILKSVQENRGISDYRIVTECTAETRDQHILPAKILIKPINALEYISITFTIYPESVSFDD